MTVMQSLDFLNSTIPSEKLVISKDGEVILYQIFFSTKESNLFFAQLRSNVKWRQENIWMFGKTIPIPRLSAWYGDEGKSYTYSGITHHPLPWIPVISQIKNRIEIISKVKFNSVLLNLYRHGKDSMSWHSDDELELGKNPIIASVSFGETRRFCFRHKQFKAEKVAINLTHGSLLLMRGATQHYWQHQVPKTAKVVDARINLTFRVIK